MCISSLIHIHFYLLNFYPLVIRKYEYGPYGGGGLYTLHSYEFTVSEAN